jgi:thiamine transport system permease protein
VDYLYNAFIFTLWQAAASASIAVVGGFICAALMWRAPTRFRQSLIGLSCVTFVLPTTAASFALIAILSVSPWSSVLFTPTAVVLGHVYFNLPLVTYVLTNAMGKIPQDALKQTELLRLTKWQCAAYVIWPQLKPYLLNLWLLIFVLCINSFGSVLLLGGGPSASTLEVVIYEALKFDFNIPTALKAAGLQLMCCLVAYLILVRSSHAMPSRSKAHVSKHSSVISTLMLLLYSSIILAPIVMLLIEGLKAVPKLDVDTTRLIFNSSVTSLCYAVPAAILSVTFAGSICCIRQRRVLDVFVLAVTSISPVIVGLCFWLLMMRVGISSVTGVMIMAHAFIFCAFNVRILSSDVQSIVSTYRRDYVIMRLRPTQIFRHVYVPLMKQSIVLCICTTLLLSIGELAIAAILADHSEPPLPVLMTRFASAYQFDLASLLASALCVVSICLFSFASKGNVLADR